MLQDFTCGSCPLRDVCQTPCAAVESVLPNEEQGALHALRRKGALQAAFRIAHGKHVTHLMLDYRDELPKQQRAIFDLYYNDGLTHEQIALRLGLHRQTVARQLHAAETALLTRARQDMRMRN